MFHVEPNTPSVVLAKTKDHLVTGESFEVHLDTVSQIAQTVPAPSQEKLAHYYASEYISRKSKARVDDYLYALFSALCLNKKNAIVKAGNGK